MENELRITEIRNVLLGTARYHLEQRSPRKGGWIIIARFDSLEKARAAEQFIRENGTTTVEQVIET